MGGGVGGEIHKRLTFIIIIFVWPGALCVVRTILVVEYLHVAITLQFWN